MKLKFDGDFTADDLRGIADMMDNPKWLINENCNTIEEFIERVGLK